MVPGAPNFGVGKAWSGNILLLVYWRDELEARSSQHQGKNFRQRHFRLPRFHKSFERRVDNDLVSTATEMQRFILCRILRVFLPD